MLIPFGILAASGEVSGDYELISTTILGSAAASVTFSGLGAFASDYKHLQIRAACMFDTTNSNIQARINGDTGTNYARHSTRAFGSGYQTDNGVNINQMLVHYNQDNTSTNEPAAAVIDFVDVYAAKNKTMRSLSATVSGAGKNQIQLSSGLWRSTSSVTSITLQAGTSLDSSGGNFRTNSRFSLYGIRG